MVVKPYGMILSTGPTGSGKSTTVYSMLKKVNKPDINIITLEDPVEYRMEKIRQIQFNRKAGMTFASGLRAVMRQDPDVIMVGEIRDAETASIAVQSAMTGHRVLSTVHTNDAAGAITRFIDMGIGAVSGFVGHGWFVLPSDWSERFAPFARNRINLPGQRWNSGDWTEVEGANFMQGTGCFNCMDKGFKGRTGIYEVLNYRRDGSGHDFEQKVGPGDYPCRRSGRNTDDPQGRRGRQGAKRRNHIGRGCLGDYGLKYNSLWLS